MKKFRLNREDALLFIIDIQEKLVPAMKDSDILLNNTLNLLKTAEVMGMEVIATEQYPKGLGSTLEILKEYIKDENIFTKTSFSACLDGVKSFIEKSGKKKIIIAGMEAHVCVYQTARDLLDLGFDVHIASDAIDSRTEENLTNAIGLLRDMGAVITNTETVLFDLLGKAGTEEFKTISKFIK